MKEKEFNTIEIIENNGIGKIKLDETEVRGLEEYRIKRNSDIVDLTLTISVSAKYLKTNIEQENSTLEATYRDGTKVAKQIAQSVSRALKTGGT